MNKAVENIQQMSILLYGPLHAQRGVGHSRDRQMPSRKTADAHACAPGDVYPVNMPCCILCRQKVSGLNVSHLVLATENCLQTNTYLSRVTSFMLFESRRLGV
jgi:hypothetical protein